MTYQNSALTAEDVQALRTPFEAREHSFDGGYLHVKEFYICDRLEKIDPAWSFVIESVSHRMIVGTKEQLQVTAIGHLTLKGVTRSGVGMGLALQTKGRTDKTTGEVYTDEANEAEKAAATDALIRAARLFGVGRYLLIWRKQVKTPEQLAEWVGKAAHQNGG